MNKMTVLLVAVTFLCVTSYAADTVNTSEYMTAYHTNGNAWKVMTEGERLYYVRGMIEAVNFCSEVKMSFPKGEADKKSAQRALQNLGQFIIGGMPPKEIVQRIDAFYSDSKNLKIRVTDAYNIVVADSKAWFPDVAARNGTIRNMREFSDKN